MKRIIALLATLAAACAAFAQNISFADPECKAICVKYFDTDFDGELSEAEAAAVTDLRKSFFRSRISSFDELRFFIGLTKISNMAFKGSTLRSVILPEGVESVGKGAFQDCVSLKAVSLPGSLVTIEDTAFSGCSSLGEIAIPDKVETIGYQAFAGCTALEALTIPKGISLLGDDALFASGIKELTMLCKEPPSCPALVLPDSIQKIFIPKGTLSTWKNEEGWEKYSNKLIK